MGRFRRNLPVSKNAVRLFLLLPYLLFALVPQGFMPAFDSGSGFTVVICTGQGLKSVTLDENGNEVPSDKGGDDQSATNSHCLFAGVGAVALPGKLPEVGSGPVTLSNRLPRKAVAAAPRAVHRQNAARAPPRSA